MKRYVLWESTCSFLRILCFLKFIFKLNQRFLSISMVTWTAMLPWLMVTWLPSTFSVALDQKEDTKLFLFSTEHCPIVTCLVKTILTISVDKNPFQFLHQHKFVNVCLKTKRLSITAITETSQCLSPQHHIYY